MLGCSNVALPLFVHVIAKTALNVMLLSVGTRSGVNNLTPLSNPCKAVTKPHRQPHKKKKPTNLVASQSGDERNLGDDLVSEHLQQKG